MGTKYSSNSASGYNSTPPADDGTVSEANKVKWDTIKTKLADPVKTLADTINSELATHFDNGPTALSTNTTLTASHYNQIIQVSAGATLTLTDAATLGAGWYCDIVNTSTTANSSLSTATASNTIDGVTASYSILPYQSLRAFVIAAGNGFRTCNLSNNTQRKSRVIYKSADETVNNSTTLQADDHLVVPIAANEKWVLKYNLILQGTLSSSGWKFSFDVPASATIVYDVQAVGGANSGQTFGTSVYASYDEFIAATLLGADAQISIILLVENSTNAGNITLYWAQSTAHASDTILKKGSFLTANQVG